jgi:hypothetical protein
VSNWNVNIDLKLFIRILSLLDISTTGAGSNEPETILVCDFVGNKPSQYIPLKLQRFHVFQDVVVFNVLLH